MFVWPKTDGLCYASAGPSGCFSTHVLIRRGAMIGSSGRESVDATRVFALARDGVDEVQFLLKDGSWVTATVRDNALLEDLPQPPRLARWVNSDGSAATQADLVPRFILD